MEAVAIPIATSAPSGVMPGASVPATTSAMAGNTTDTPTFAQIIQQALGEKGTDPGEQAAANSVKAGQTTHPGVGSATTPTVSKAKTAPQNQPLASSIFPSPIIFSTPLSAAMPAMTSLVPATAQVESSITKDTGNSDDPAVSTSEQMPTIARAVPIAVVSSASNAAVSAVMTNATNTSQVVPAEARSEKTDSPETGAEQSSDKSPTSELLPLSLPSFSNVDANSETSAFSKTSIAEASIQTPETIAPPASNEANSPSANAPRNRSNVEVTTPMPVIPAVQGEAISSVLRDLKTLQAKNASVQILSAAPSSTSTENFTGSTRTQTFDHLKHGAAVTSPLAAEQTELKTNASATPASVNPPKINIPGAGDTHGIASGQNSNASSGGHSSSQDSTSNHNDQTTVDTPETTEASALPSPKMGPASFSQAVDVATTMTPQTDAPNSTTNTNLNTSPPITMNNSMHSAVADTDATSSHASAPTPAVHLPETAASRFVNEAELLQNAAHSEMRISVQTDKLGTVELRARVAGDEIGAAITVEKKDVHAALAVELPSLQRALSEKQLKVEEVSLSQGSLGSATGDRNAQAQQKEQEMPRTQSAQTFSGGAITVPSVLPVMSETTGIFDNRGRLSVHV